MRILQEERNGLLTRNEALSIKIADLSTIERLTEEVDQKQMIIAQKPIFLRGDTAVAKK